MFSRSTRVALLLVGGLLINLMVAWGCVLLHGPQLERWAPYHNPRGEDPLVVFVTHRFGHEIVSACGRPGTLLDRHGDKVRTYHGPLWWPREAAAFGTMVAHGNASGWPMLSLSVWRTTDITVLPDGPRFRSTPVYHWGLAFDRDIFGRQAQRSLGPNRSVSMLFPLRPVWRGLVGNTAFFGAALWLPLFGVPMLRRARRRRRGLCPVCAYPVGEAARCTECGVLLPVDRAPTSDL